MTRATEQWLAEYRRRQAKDSRPEPSPGSALGKYRNRKIVDAEGIEHDSRKEYLRWLELKRRESVGAISELHRQVVFDLCVGDVLVCRYIADATYVEEGAQVVEDSKSSITAAKPDFRIKLKLMRAIHGIDVRVIE